MFVVILILSILLSLSVCAENKTDSSNITEKGDVSFAENDSDIVSDWKQEEVITEDSDISNGDALGQKTGVAEIAEELNEKIKGADVSPFSSIAFSAIGEKTLVATIKCYDDGEINLNRYQDEAYTFHLELIDLYGTENYVMELFFDYNFAGKHFQSRFINGAGVSADDPRIAEEILAGTGALEMIAERIEKEATEEWLENIIADGGEDHLVVEVYVSEEKYWVNREKIRVYCIDLRDALEQEMAEKGYSGATLEVNLVAGASRYSFTNRTQEASYVFGYGEGSLDIDGIFEICNSVPPEAFEEYKEFYNTYADIDVDQFFYSGLKRADFQVTFVVAENGYYYLLRGHQPYTDDKVRLQEQLVDTGCVDVSVNDMSVSYVVPHEAAPERSESYTIETYDTNFGIAIYR